MGYETLTYLTGNVTMAETITAVGGLAILGAAAYLFYVVARAYKSIVEDAQERSVAKTAYCKMVYALKCGIIKQAAEADNIELIYPKTEERTLIESIKDDVREDIAKV